MLRLTSRRYIRALKGWSAEYQRRQYSSQYGRLAGKVALITGGASGIGKATAAEFIGNGAKVVIADVQDKLGEETAAELGPDAAFVRCDVTQESDISNAVDFAISKHSHLDIMHNNAAVFNTDAASISKLNLSEFDLIMSVNVRGIVAGIKHATRVMIPRQTGCILCMSSVAGILGGIVDHSYTISKFAVVGMVKSAASELCKHGIRVNCISPTAVPTPAGISWVMDMYPGTETEKAVEMIYRAGELKGAKCKAEDIAKAAVYLASDDAKYVSGHNLVVDGGFTAYKRFTFEAGAEVKK